MSTIVYPDSPLLKDVARELVEIYDKDLFKGAIQPEAILFVEDTITQASEAKRLTNEAKVFEVKELHPALAERLNADYMVIFYKLNALNMDGEKINAHLMEALMRIKPGGGLKQPDVKTFVPLARTLGPDWKKRKFIATDIRAGGLLKGMQTQARLDLGGHVGTIAESAAAAVPGLPVSVSVGENTAAVKAEQAADWQPTQLPASKDNVVQFQRPTGTTE